MWQHYDFCSNCVSLLHSDKIKHSNIGEHLNSIFKAIRFFFFNKKQ